MLLVMLLTAVLACLTSLFIEGGYAQKRQRVPPSWIKNYDDEKVHSYTFGMYYIEPNSFKIGTMANGEVTYLCMVPLEFVNNETLLANKRYREVTHMPGYSSLESGLCRAFFLGPSLVFPTRTIVTASVFRHMISTGVYSYHWEPLPADVTKNQLVKFENFEQYFVHNNPKLQWGKVDYAVVVARIKYNNNHLPGLQIYNDTLQRSDTFYVLLDGKVFAIKDSNAFYAVRKAHSGEG
ncbi:uncharacterized protein LOC119381396 [Rhipicephalus sanguineus]|uniref:uncharacterized protein LOC119381396 n=1 Tax=Rhipicephalus sanguineus TaxID=34632 RepID=UPI001895CA60|nr:uncharacterized protein LOC119381396 [Rhipicephalus sanguineus]